MEDPRGAHGGAQGTQLQGTPAAPVITFIYLWVGPGRPGVGYPDPRGLRRHQVRVPRRLRRAEHVHTMILARFFGHLERMSYFSIFLKTF